MIGKPTLWSRALFLLPAAVIGLLLFTFPALVYLRLDQTRAIFLLSLLSLVIGLALSFLPVVHRFERFLAARLFGTTLGDPSARAAYQNAVWFSALHLIAGIAVQVCSIAVPMAVNALAWRARAALSSGPLSADVLGGVADLFYWSELRIVVTAIVLVSTIGAVAWFVCAPLLAERLLGPDLETRLAETEADRQRLELQTEMARDIHDSIGHTLTIATLQAESGRAQLDSAPEATRESLSVILAVCRSAQADLDEVLRALRTGRSGIDTDVRDLSSLGDLIDNVRRAGLKAVADVPLNLSIPPEVSRSLYRMVQEILTNALRHAQPRELTLGMWNDPEGGIRLIASNPIAVEGSVAEGRGLQGIRARTELLGGRCAIGVVDGRFGLDIALPARPASVPAAIPSAKA